MHPRGLLMSVQRWSARFCSLTIVAFSGLFTSPGVRAWAEQGSGFLEQQRQAASKNPPGILFTLWLKGQVHQFHPGEIISLELGFASTLSKTYVALGSFWDRSGRAEIDAFHVEPLEGVVDPLRDYFGLRYGRVGGSVSSSSVLEEKPQYVEVELNDHFRFDKPGHYRLYVTSGRVSPYSNPQAALCGENPLPVTSNAVEFEILPSDPAWAENELQSFIRRLDSDPFPDMEHEEASRGLRFLGTEAAAREMVRRLASAEQHEEFQYEAGLFGSPHRKLIVEEMEARLAVPDQPITEMFLGTLSALAAVQHHPKLPLVDLSPTDSTAVERAVEQGQEWQRAIEDEKAKYIQQLLGCVLTKQGTAGAVTLATLFRQPECSAEGRKAGTAPSWCEDVRSGVAGAFRELPPEGQLALMLSPEWKDLASPTMVPVLEEIFEKPPGTPFPICETALQRIYEIAPQEGRRLILKEIGRPHPRVGITTLGSLPDESLPGLDKVLADDLDRDLKERPNLREWETHALLLTRYATPAVLPRIAAAYGDYIGLLPCLLQNALLDYFLKSDANFGGEMVEKALVSRGPKTRCYQSALAGLSGMTVGGRRLQAYEGPELEKLAVAHLDDSSPPVRASAANVLGRLGTPGDEKLLWSRFEKWHQVWQGRAAELSEAPTPDLAAQDEIQLESSLFHALAWGRSWLLNRDKLVSLRDLCVSKGCREQAERMVEAWTENPVISVSSEPDRGFSMIVRNYQAESLDDLRQKLSQYPRRTVFTLQTRGLGQEPEAQQLLTRIRATAQELGMKLAN